MTSENKWDELVTVLPSDATEARIESTARDLESLNYEPLLLFKTPAFLRMKRGDLKMEVERVRRLSNQEMVAAGVDTDADMEEFRDRHLQLLIYHYGLLCRLRADDPTTWNTITELMEDD